MARVLDSKTRQSAAASDLELSAVIRPHLRQPVGCAALAALLLAGAGAGARPEPAAAAGSAIQGAQALAFLNQQRRVNGIPQLRTLKQRFSTAWCPKEDSGPSGGESFRDWSSETSWATASGPWDEAPLHQQSLYDPVYTSFGDSLGGAPLASCAGLGDYRSPWRAPAFFAFTSTAGLNRTPVSENVVGELPFAPQQRVGIRQGVVTGPNLIVYAEGFSGEQEYSANPARTQPAIVSASLTGPAGLVKDVRVVNPSQLGVGSGSKRSWIVAPGAAFVIPRYPLAPGTAYRAKIVWRLAASGQRATQTFTFRTVNASQSPPPAGTGATYTVTATFPSMAPAGTTTPATALLERAAAGHLVTDASGTTSCLPGAPSSQAVVPAPACSIWSTVVSAQIQLQGGPQTFTLEKLFGAKLPQLTAGRYRLSLATSSDTETVSFKLS